MNKNERIKEIREWLTFVFTIITFVAAPIGLMVLKNQRLEIESAADAKYETKADAATFEAATNSKLDKISDAAEATRQDVAAIKAQVAIITERKKNP
jgi:hypothetical protein